MNKRKRIVSFVFFLVIGLAAVMKMPQLVSAAEASSAVVETLAVTDVSATEPGKQPTGAGPEGEPSQGAGEEEKAPSDQTSPKVPEKVKEICLCALGTERVKLTWEKAEGATHYWVYRRKKGSSTYRRVGVVTKGAFTDKGLSFGSTYQYRIVPVARASGVTTEGKPTSVTYRNIKVVATDHQKYSYTEMKADIELLAENYHGLVNYEAIGKTADGRNIYDVILGNPEAKKTLLVVSTLHAREYMASLVCMNQIEYCLQNYGKKIDGKRVKDTLDKIAIHYIPMANPDGVTLSQYGVSKIHSAPLKKLIRKIGRGRTTRWKANARGVDLNRNYPVGFYGTQERASEGSQGPSAASEKETKAILGLLKKLNKDHQLKGVVNYHAMGSIIYGSCKAGAAYAKDTARMYQVAKCTTGYRKAYETSSPKKDSGKKRSDGSFRSYVMNKLSLPSITLEVGRTSCPGPIREFPSIWSRNKNVVLREARLFA